MSFTRSVIAGTVLYVALLADGAAAQGGWRQWDIYLRDGRHIVASPLGAPDDFRFATTPHHDGPWIQRRDVAYIAARTDKNPEPYAGVPLPAVPGDSCRDVIVRLDGRRTYGHVTLADVQFSEGVVVQNGEQIQLTEVAYIRFGRNR